MDLFLEGFTGDKGKFTRAGQRIRFQVLGQERSQGFGYTVFQNQGRDACVVLPYGILILIMIPDNMKYNPVIVRIFVMAVVEPILSVPVNFDISKPF